MKSIIFLTICLAVTFAIPLENVFEQSASNSKSEEHESSADIIFDKNDDNRSQEELAKENKVLTDLVTNGILESKEEVEAHLNEYLAGKNKELIPSHVSLENAILSQSNFKSDINLEVSSNLENLGTSIGSKKITNFVPELKEKSHEDVVSSLEALLEESVPTQLDPLLNPTVNNEKQRTKSSYNLVDVKTIDGKMVENIPKGSISYIIKQQTKTVPNFAKKVKIDDENADFVSSLTELESKYSGQAEIETSTDEQELKLPNQSKYYQGEIVNSKQNVESTLKYVHSIEEETVPEKDSQANKKVEQFTQNINKYKSSHKINSNVNPESQKLVDSVLPKSLRSSEVVNNNILANDGILQKDDYLINGPLNHSSNLTVPIHIVRYISNRRREGGYDFSFETQNGITRTEEGQLKQVVDEKNKLQKVVVVRGSYQYPKEDGTFEKITYFADETGYHAEGDSIPKPVIATHRHIS